jgi:hypothetical protein
MSVLPTVPELTKSTLVTLGGILIAAFILSRCPKLRNWAAGQSLTVKDTSGKILYWG